MRSYRTLLIIAGLLLAGGTLLVTLDSGDSAGWFAYAPESDSFGLGSVYLLTAREVLGLAALWVASLIVTGVVVHQLVVHRFTREDGPSE